jgi:RNA polymerase sigma-70 factor (ECF subfamily)
MLTHVDEIDLVNEIAAGSSPALAEAYRRHSGPVYGLALHLVREASLAEDVTQEVFLRLWNRPHTFDPTRGTLRAFLLMHTRGRSIDLIRSEGARRIREQREGRLAQIATPQLEDEIMDLTRAEETRSALHALDDTEREAIELAYFGGYTYREVAEILGIPEGTIKSRIRSGMKRMQSILANRGLAAAR